MRSNSISTCVPNRNVDCILQSQYPDKHRVPTIMATETSLSFCLQTMFDFSLCKQQLKLAIGVDFWGISKRNFNKYFFL